MQLCLPLADDAAPPAADGGADRVVFVRDRRARRYILRLLPDGTLRVTMPRRGARREALAFVEQSRAWIARQRAEQAGLPPAMPPAVAAAHRARARRELPPALLALASRHGLTVARVSVRNQQSRWGSCSRSGRITLNWRLVLVPDFVREYVMLHELMHLRELNHSRRFWRLVAGVCPRFIEARRWLLDEGRRLF
ncbi:MAG: M48 family metallopeptidase [Acidobacteriota bacterium]